MRFVGALSLLWLLAVVTAYEGRCDDGIDASTTELNEAMIAYVGGADVRAFRLLPALAERDVAIAQLLLSRLYLHSPLVTRDCEAGIKWLSRSMSNGNGEAAYDLGILFRRGYCINQSDSSALGAFLNAAALGYPGAPRAIGELYLGSSEVAPDHKAAIEWFKKGTAMFDSDSCYQLGRLYSGGGDISSDYGEAYMWFEISASLAFLTTDQYARALDARDRVREQLSPSEVQIARTVATRQLDILVRENRQRRVADAR